MEDVDPLGPAASPWSRPASWSHAVVASKFINTQHEAQTTKQDQKIPQAREKERRHDSADRLLGVLHTPELNQTSNPTYTTGLRDEGSEFGEPARFDTASGKDNDVQDHRCY